jgi:hypothetical protein
MFEKQQRAASPKPAVRSRPARRVALMTAILTLTRRRVKRSDRALTGGGQK